MWICSRLISRGVKWNCSVTTLHRGCQKYETFASNCMATTARKHLTEHYSILSMIAHALATWWSVAICVRCSPRSSVVSDEEEFLATLGMTIVEGLYFAGLKPPVPTQRLKPFSVAR